jgi:transposase-like protein
VRQAACAHTNLTARWDDAQDVGKAEKTSRYACVSCGEMFTRDEAQTLGGTYAA